MNIVVCEPQCWGFEHALFNAALLKTVLLAYPEAKLTYLGEHEHLEWVRAYLDEHAGNLTNRLECRAIPIPKPDYAHWGYFTPRGFREELRWYRLAHQLIADTSAALFLITSITNPGLLAVKLSMYAERSQVPTIVIPHSILMLVLNKHPLKKLRSNLYGFRGVLKLPQPEQLRYIALGGSIYSHLSAAEPKLAAYFRSLDPPYLWQRGYPLVNTVAGEKIRFGFFGVGFKGFDQFAQLAREIVPQAANVEFTLVGYLNRPTDPQVYIGAVSGVTEQPLSTDEFSRRAASLAYSVWCADPQRYRLAASVSFIDSLSFGKPGIYLNNPYIAHYFERMGDIGYLCDSLTEMQEAILSILRHFPTDRYRQQCENIQRERHIFEPETLAPQFRSIAESLSR